MNVVPEDPREWDLFLNGRPNNRARQITVKESKYFVSSYIITEKKPSNGKPYHQYFFWKVENCQEGGPAYLQIFQVGGNQGRKKVGSYKRCLCSVS